MDAKTHRKFCPGALVFGLALALSAFACDGGGQEFTDPGARLRAEGWLRGDLHMHTTWSDGDDSVATTIAIAEYLEDPLFLAAHPEYSDNQLDFIAITDHRTVDCLSDPEWTSQKLLLVSGEEFGGNGHANVFGISEFVDHDPGGDGTDLTDIEAAEDDTHAQGGLFSINHPLADGDPWPWDNRRHDGLELWNSKWGMGGPPFSADQLADCADWADPVSPFFRRAVAEQTGGREAQLFAFYEAMLAKGLSPALVGGSDRHMLFQNGYPTTWIQPDGDGVDGLLAGVRAGHTFISRSPVAATVELSVEAGGAEARLGDALAIEPGQKLKIRVRVGRARGGLLRLIRGSSVASDDALEGADLGRVEAEVAIDEDDFEYVHRAEGLSPGDWLYPVVYEPLVLPGLDPDRAAKVAEVAEAAQTMGADDYAGIAGVFLDFTDVDLILHADRCDPSAWDDDHLQCVPADATGLGTFFIPDWIDRALNAVRAEGLEDYCLGAVGTAVRFVN